MKLRTQIQSSSSKTITIENNSPHSSYSNISLTLQDSHYYEKGQQILKSAHKDFTEEEEALLGQSVPQVQKKINELINSNEQIINTENNDDTTNLIETLLQYSTQLYNEYTSLNESILDLEKMDKTLLIALGQAHTIITEKEKMLNEMKAISTSSKSIIEEQQTLIQNTVTSAKAYKTVQDNHNGIEQSLEEEGYRLQN